MPLLRINRASDDASGLSIAARLNSDVRIYTQAKRNINDGLSVLSIAEGAVKSLQEINIRQKELAEQAANGILSDKQRLALHTEARALSLEYERILRTTEFNGRSLFDENNTGLVIQAGYQAGEILSLDIGQELLRTVGDGTFGSATTLTAGNEPNSLVTADFNNDGIEDLATSNRLDNTISVFLGNGDGTFQSELVSATGIAPNSLRAADINSDGILDLINNDYGNSGLGNTVSILTGNGDGTFGNRTTIDTGIGPVAIAIGDVNNDGNIDISAATGASNFISGLPEQSRITIPTNGVVEITNVTLAAAPRQEVTTINAIVADNSVAEVSTVTADAASVQEVTSITAVAGDTSVQEISSITADAIATREVTEITAIAGDTSVQEISSITADAIATQEITDITMEAGSNIVSGSYFTISSDTQDFYVWYNVDGAGADPGIVGRTGIEVAISSLDTATDVATATSSALDALGDFEASSLGDVVTITNANGGSVADAADGNIGGVFSANVITQGTNSDISNGEYFTVDSPTGAYYVWFDINNTGSNPNLGGRTGIEVDVNWGDSADAVATAIASALDAHGDFEAIAGGDTVTLTNAAGGAASNITAGNIAGGTFAVSTTQQGVNSDIQSGDYFYLNGASTQFYAWFNVDGQGGDPLVGGRTGIEIAINSADSANTVAAKMQAAIDAQAAFNASVLGDTITVTNTVGGSVTNASDQTIGGAFSVATTTQGTNSDIVNGSYFTVDSPTGAYYVWFDINNTGVNPNVGGRTGIEIDVNWEDSANTVAAAIQTALDAHGDFEAIVGGSTVTLTNTDGGAAANITKGNITGSTFAVSTTQQGVNSNILSGDYFYLNGASTQFYAWFNVDGQGGDPLVAGRTGIEIAINSADSANTVASKMQVAIDAQAAFNASVIGDTVTVTNTVGGSVTNASDQTIGGAFSVSTLTEGVTSDIANGSYFTLDTPSGAYYVWFDYNNTGVNPSVGGRTGIEVNINYGDSAGTVASAIQSAVDAHLDFGASVLGSNVTITNAETGVANNLTKGNITGSDFAVAVNTQGRDSDLQSGDYFLLNSSTNNYYFWFNVDGAGGDPSIGGRTGVEIALNGSDSSSTVASKINAVVNPLAEFSSTVLGSAVTVTNTVGGNITNASQFVGGAFTVPVATQGTDSIFQNGDYFTLDTPTTDYYVWFNYGGASDPSVAGRTGIEISANYNDSATTLATAVANALNPLAEVNATPAGSVVTITNVDEGPEGVAAGTVTGMSFTTTQAGSSPVILSGEYFELSSTTSDYYVWYNVEGAGGDPALAGKTGIQVNINNGDTGNTIATATSAAIDAQADFIASAVGNQVTITNNLNGSVTDTANVSVGGTFSVVKLQDGSSTRVDVSTDSINIPSHNFLTGLEVTLTSGGTLPGGLSAATSYYIIALDNNNIAFASSYANALSDTRINLTSFGTGVHSIIPQGQTSAGGFTFGNGDGTFSNTTSFDAGQVPQFFEVGDFNNDGYLDVATAEANNDRIEINLGNGTGSFTKVATYSVGADPSGIVAVDFDLDGNEDLVSTSSTGNNINVLKGNGSGLFTVTQSINTEAGPSAVATGDLNGDGLSDFVTANYGSGSGNTGSIFLATAEGTINAHGTITTSGVGTNAVQISDFNSDGINDLAFANSDGTVTVHMGNSTQTMSMGFVDLTSQESARNALTFLSENLTRISNEIASLGASQSRLEIAAQHTATTIIGYQSASDSIMSADIAAESANYVRNSIKLKAGAAVLAQANLSPKLALKLLDNN